MVITAIPTSDPPALPTLWAEQLQHPTPPSSAAELTDVIPNGRRNEVLFGLASLSRRYGLSDTGTLAIVGKINECCERPLTPGELQRVASSAAKYPALERPAPRFALMTVDELRSKPKQSFLVDGVIAARQTIALFGPMGSFKTTVLHDLLLSIATGQPWAGRDTHPGAAVLVQAEGDAGLMSRITAWEMDRETPAPSRLHILTQPVQLHVRSHVDAIIELLEGLPEPPVIVGIDTLARCTVGADENSARDMGIVIAAVDRIRDAIGTSVLLVHHTGHNGNFRGSTALTGALDTILRASKSGNRVTISCEKQRDFGPFEPFTLRSKSVQTDDRSNALVLDLAETSQSNPTANTAHVLEALGSFGPDGATKTEWERKCVQGPPKISRGTFYNVVATLPLGAVEQLGHGKGTRFVQGPTSVQISPFGLSS